MEDWRAALRRRPDLSVLTMANIIMHYAVAVVLLAVAAVVLWHTGYDLATTKQPFVSATTSAVDGALFTIIILEVMRTVVAHLESGGVEFQPFLIIGAISAVRSILAVGARLSLQGTQQPPPSTGYVHTALLELGVNAAVVVALALALVLVRRLAQMAED
jgi:uncharacterized membrane protein (DUF373 family)